MALLRNSTSTPLKEGAKDSFTEDAEEIKIDLIRGRIVKSHVSDPLIFREFLWA